MNPQEKELSLKDLCARLPHGVKVWYKYYSENVTAKFATSIRLVDGKIALSSKFNREGDWYPIEEANELLIKPYLRSMSSMTEEEKEELSHLLPKGWSVEIDKLNNFYFDINPSIFIEIDVFLNIINWFNAHHFDYRGLIPMGLAIAVTKENNPYEFETILF